MINKYSSGLWLVLVIFFGCTSLRTGSEFQYGRQAMLRGDGDLALSYFRSAAERDPNYTHGTALRQGIWSYVGRTEYATGRLTEARQSLEKAVAANRDENLARLYLGLTLARSGDRDRGLKEIEGGMRGIHEFIEYVAETHRNSFGQFWDPRRELRSAIEGDLAILSKREFDVQRIITNGEWLGKELEEEIDRARRDEIRELSRDGEGRSDSQP